LATINARRIRAMHPTGSMTKIHNTFPRLTKSEGEAKLRNWCRSYAAKPYSGNVYHYTNVAALGGILSNRSIFCTDHCQLNDSTELSLGLEVVEAAIAANAESAGVSNDDVGHALDHLAPLRKAPFNLSMFAASFSMHGNDLTQWRAYSPKNGVCIGFREAVLTRIAQKQHFVCGAVRYLGAPLFNEWLAEQLAEMKEGLEKTAKNEAVLREQASGDPKDHVDMIVQFQRSGNLERWIGEVAGLLKNPDFQSEQEWRCVSVIRENTIQPKKPVRFRESGSRVVRFVDLDFSNVHLNELISEVIIGPGADGKETFRMVGELLRSAEVTASVQWPNHAVK
jgi:hypothetical protein